MRPIFSSLTAIALLFRMVLGCGCAHGDDSRNESPSQQFAFAMDEQAEVDAHQSHQHDDNCPGHDQELCHCPPFAAVQNNHGIHSVTDYFSVFFATLQPVLEIRRDSCQPRIGVIEWSDLSPPVRRHLLLQVLRT